MTYATEIRSRLETALRGGRRGVEAFEDWLDRVGISIFADGSEQAAIELMAEIDGLRADRDAGVLVADEYVRALAALVSRDVQGLSEHEVRVAAINFLAGSADVASILTVASRAHAALDDPGPMVNGLLALASELRLGAVSLEEARDEIASHLGLQAIVLTDERPPSFAGAMSHLESRQRRATGIELDVLLDERPAVPAEILSVLIAGRSSLSPPREARSGAVLRQVQPQISSHA